MNAQVLEAKLSTTITKMTVVLIVKELERQCFSVKELIDLAFHTRSEIGFRAAWILENDVLNDKNRLLSVLPYFLKKFVLVDNPSCKRHFVKILQEITFHFNAKKADQILQREIFNSDLESVVETCFDWMIDTKVAVAVKVFCME